MCIRDRIHFTLEDLNRALGVTDDATDKAEADEADEAEADEAEAEEADALSLIHI